MCYYTRHARHAAPHAHHEAGVLAGAGRLAAKLDADTAHYEYVASSGFPPNGVAKLDVDTAHYEYIT